jgi:CRP-like cAMP-binding protein
VNDQQEPAELNAFLADIPFFASLDETTRLELAGQLEPVHVIAGEVIFREGDPGTGLFLVVSGRLRLSVAADGAERVLYDVGRGAIIGEMAALTDRPRAATVQAVRDSDLLLLRVSSFTALLERSPALVTGMIRLLADRVLAVDRLLTVDRPQLPPPGRTIAVVGAGQHPRAAPKVAGLLGAQLARAGSVFQVDADVVARRLGPGAAQRGPGDPGRAELTGWLHAVERDHDHVIYQPDAEDTAWSRLCLSQSDVVLLVASAEDEPSLGAVEARALATGALRCELALLHQAAPADPDHRRVSARQRAGRSHARASRPRQHRRG